MGAAFLLALRTTGIELMRRVLWLSNGHGEDTIACELIRVWQGCFPEDQHQAMALVGEGKAYAQLKVPLVTETFTPPSAGFAYLHPLRLWQDVRQGLVGHFYQQWQYLKACFHMESALAKQCADQMLCIAVGDVVPLTLLWLTGGLSSERADRTLFLACALSDYYTAGKSCFDPFQVGVLRRYRVPTYTRDALTARNLVARGVQAQCLGNPVRDAVQSQGAPPPALTRSGVHALLLPGSHQDALLNLRAVLPLLTGLSEAGGRVASVQWHILYATEQDRSRFAACLDAWRLQTTSARESVCATSRPFITLLPARQFGHGLRQCDFALGFSGTGNEQCVAHGLPVISFPGPAGVQQYTPAFGEAQQRLLGSALRFYPQMTPELLRWQIDHLLRYTELYRTQAKQVGQARFGEPGSALRLVHHMREKEANP